MPRYVTCPKCKVPVFKCLCGLPKVSNPRQSMTNEELWTEIVKRNPPMQLGDDTRITLTKRGLKKLFDTAYAHGLKQGTASIPPDPFKALFGKEWPFNEG